MIDRDGYCDHYKTWHQPDRRYWNNCPYPWVPLKRAPQPTPEEQAAERLAEQINDGDHIVITSGRLTYRKRSTKLGEQSRMEILVWAVDRLSESSQEERSGASEGKDIAPESIDAPEPAPASTVRKRGYPKVALSGGF
jgi:hypothetical protein